MSETRCVTIGRATLYLGDCLALREQLPKADMLVSDPPYGIGYVHSGHGQGARPKTKAIAGDDQPFDPTPWLQAAPRVLLWGADHFRARLPHGGRFLCWDKSVGVGQHDSFTDAEYAWTNVPTIKRNVFRHLWKGFVRAKSSLDHAQAGTHHVSQKPVALMRWCIELLRCPADGVVLDPYMGSGTTGVAALSLGKRFVGVEIDAEHFEAACERMRRACAELGLPE